MNLLREPDLNNSTTEVETPFSGWLMRAIKYTAIALVALYMVDAAWFYVRQTYPSVGKANGSVHRVRLLAIPDKGNKTEFEVDAVQPEEDVPCANSLFSHGGERPCWYVVRHAKDPIPM
jgi:hypothetical protein